MTWDESWNCSKSSTTRRVYTKSYPATRPGRKRAAQRLSQPALRITAGEAIATDCLNCQLLPEWQFAMYSIEQRHWDDVAQYMNVIASVLNAYSDRLEQLTSVSASLGTAVRK